MVVDHRDHMVLDHRDHMVLDHRDRMVLDHRDRMVLEQQENMMLDHGEHIVDYYSLNGCLRCSQSWAPGSSFVGWRERANLFDVRVYQTGNLLVTYPIHSA